LNTYVDSEACPINLAPTNSTTAQLVMGDAIAVCLMEMKNFTAEDFAKYHPGGALGKKLLLRVSDMLQIKWNDFEGTNINFTIKKNWQSVIYKCA
jgi:arabinose-5-phosphate isomerase